MIIDLYNNDKRLLVQLDLENCEVHIDLLSKEELTKLESECNEDNIVLEFKNEDLLTVISRSK